ncbi:MAG: DNA-binding response regulator [Flavobacterium psychrophilum]|nr:MAG: DNA-binding response regulator [Flavobacterium psychrophilum]
MVVLEGYRSIFSMLEGKNFNGLAFTKARDCKSGYEVLEKHRDTPFDIAVIDYSIPEYPEMKLFSGHDMAVQVRKLMPKCKIVMMTMHKEMEIMNNILGNINPEGFINKSDCNTEEIAECFEAVLEDETYYSNTISSYIKRQEKGIMLDEIDTKIIILLSKGIRTKNLSKYIPLSDSAIEKRKYKVKKILDVTGDDEALIAEARKQGYI